jgi:4-amino-4-deoxy-L-arabinose transferase-like glycosyltransferase
LWHPWAKRFRLRWYRDGVLALIAGCAILAAWAIPAGQAGGEVYREALFFTQTAGRVVDSFDHAQPWWWYASVVPALLLPWLLWPRAWQAVSAAVSTRRHPGTRFLLCWLVPVLVGFSLVSGKQVYYLLPELTGAAILFASGFDRLATRHHAASPVAGTWVLAVATFSVAALMLMLPTWIGAGHLESNAIIDISRVSPWFAVAIGVIGGLFFLAPRQDEAAVRHVGALSIAAACLAYLVFAHSFWVQFDLRPAAQRIAALQKAGVPVAHFLLYENQFQYLGRLDRPLDVVDTTNLDRWAVAHPQGRIVRYVDTLTADDLAYAELVQPFRSTWLLIDPVGPWIQRVRGLHPPYPDQPAKRFPADYWPYARVLAKPTAAPIEGS